jgi:CxxC-x17-CxxC domain-containing protein
MTYTEKSLTCSDCGNSFPITTCAQCGKQTEVPFQPRGDKPVYCSDCYSKIKVSRKD